jgi:hypothetical protein
MDKVILLYIHDRKRDRGVLAGLLLLPHIYCTQIERIFASTECFNTKEIVYYRVIKTRVEVWEKLEILWELLVSPKLPQMFLPLHRNTEKMLSISFIK